MYSLIQKFYLLELTHFKNASNCLSKDASLSVLATKQKQVKCPSIGSIGEWLNKLWYIHSLQNYPAIQNTELDFERPIQLDEIFFKWQNNV